MPSISCLSLEAQGRISVSLQVRGMTQYCSLNAHGLAWPSQAASLLLRREKGAATASSYLPPCNHLALSQPAQRPPFHPGLLHSLYALPLVTNPQWSLHTPFHMPQSSPLPEEGHHLCPLSPFPLTGTSGRSWPGGRCWGRRWTARQPPWGGDGHPEVLLQGLPQRFEPFTSTVLLNLTETLLGFPPGCQTTCLFGSLFSFLCFIFLLGRCSSGSPHLTNQQKGFLPIPAGPGALPASAVPHAPLADGPSVATSPRAAAPQSGGPAQPLRSLRATSGKRREAGKRLTRRRRCQAERRCLGAFLAG